VSRGISIGLLFSTTGPYSVLSRAMQNGAFLAVDEVNRNATYDFHFEPEIVDPAATLENYRLACEEMLRNKNIQHVIGCYTSSSRKEVIPCFEKHDAMLWYPSHYEGFESSNNVIYTGAAPNHHIVPLARFMMKNYGNRAYCVGSNYIWAWENNRVLREILEANGGEIVSEKYLAVGSGDVEYLIEDIRKNKPDFIYCALIGESKYAFIDAVQKLREKDPAFGPDQMPISDCSLSEPELFCIGPEASRGLISSSVYFQSIHSEQNNRFIADYKAHFGQRAVASADSEAVYIAVLILAKAIHKVGTDSAYDVREATLGSSIAAPQGQVVVDEDNAHCYLTPRLGRGRDDQNFDILFESEKPVKPDPYLVWFDSRHPDADRSDENSRPALRRPENRLRVVK